MATSKKKSSSSDNEPKVTKKVSATKKTVKKTAKSVEASSVSSAEKKKITSTKKKTVSKKTTTSVKKNIENVAKKDDNKEVISLDYVDIVRELPDRYNETKLVLMIRDPEYCFFYWDISDYDFNAHQLKDRRITVRFFHVFGYDITNGELHTEVDVNYIYGDRYINLNMPHAYFIAELGYYDDNNMFLVLARSNMIYAPRDTMSSIYDEEWLVNEDIVKILKTTPALRESLSSATICELLDLRQNHLSSSSLFRKKEVLL